MIELRTENCRVSVLPENGGTILRYDWRGQPVMRPACGPSVLDAACFPLVPFSNRIADGRFVIAGREVRLRPNFPGSDHPHPLHGFGWLDAWSVIRRDACSLAMEHRYEGGEWPWPYRAEQTLALDEDGLTMGLAVTNEGSSPMPAGLGFHPYFPCDPDTRYRGLHRGEWSNSEDCIPLWLDRREQPRDWWEGQPVRTRSVDTVYAERSGTLEIVWPSRGLRVTLACSDSLPHTVIYSPAGQDFFCVEPVSQMTDGFNRGDYRALGGGETLAASVRLTVGAAGAAS